MSSKVKKFARGGDAGGNSGGTGTGQFTFNTDGSGYNYDYDYGAEQGADDAYYNVDGQGNATVGWTQGPNGTWVYTDETGNIYSFNEDGTEVGATPDLATTEVVGQRDPVKEEDPFELERIEAGKRMDSAPESFGGNIFTKQPDGTWEGDDGSTFTDADYQNYKSSFDAIADKEPTPTGGITSLIDKFKTPDGSMDWAKLIKAGVTAGIGIKGLQGIVNTMQGNQPSHEYQGQIDMGLQFNRRMNPQDPNRVPGSASTPFFASNTFGPAGSSAPQGIAALPQPAPSMAYAGGSQDFKEHAPASEMVMPKDARVLDTGETVDRINKRFEQPQGIAALAKPAPVQKAATPISMATPDAMRNDWNSYFNNTKAGTTLDWGGGKLTMGDNGEAVYSAKDALNGGTTLNRNSIDNPNTLQMLMSTAPGIAKQWGEQYGVQAGNNANDQKYWDSVLPKGFAAGGPTTPRYLRGDTDGMADEVKARIDGGQEARLAHGEFVIPADVVSHLGNGNSDAGAKKLYQMMDNLRVARTGTKQQGKEINPDKFLPGGKKMASGGITDAVPRFAEGGPTAVVTGVNQWAGPYATNLLSQTNAVGNDMIANPGNYVYQGQRVADTNALQNKAYQGAMNMQINNPNVSKASDMMERFATKLGDMPAYSAASVGSGYSAGPAYEATKFNTKEFDQEAAQKYMNPYLKLALDPQLEEARRQAEITRMTNAGRLVGSGAFGGGRQAIMEAEGDRNLGTNLANITGQGYNKAYDTSMQQFNADQARRLQADQAGEQSRQFGHSSGITDRANAANFGLQAAGINERSREAGARMGLDALVAGGNMASNWGNFMNNADANTRNNLNTIASFGNDLYSKQQAGLTADMNRFNEEAGLPMSALKFKKDMFTGMPVTSTTPISAPTSLAEQLSGLGLTVTDLQTLLGKK